MKLNKFIDFIRSRSSDPIESFQAADQIQEAAPQHFARIHEALLKHGPLGKDGIAYFTMLNPNAISRRLPEMKKLGMVELTGNTVTSDSKRKEREWRALP